MHKIITNQSDIHSLEKKVSFLYISSIEEPLIPKDCSDCLYLYFNEETYNWHYLSQIIDKYPDIISFSISNFKPKDSKDYVKLLRKLKENNKSLDSLSVSRTRSLPLSDIICSMPQNLVSVEITRCDVDDWGLVVNLIRALPRLTKVSFRHNELCNKNIEKIADLEERKRRSKLSIDLSYNQLYSEAIEKLVEQAEIFDILDLSWNSLDHDVIRKLLAAYKKNPSLRLRFDHCLTVPPLPKQTNVNMLYKLRDGITKIAYHGLVRYWSNPSHLRNFQASNYKKQNSYIGRKSRDYIFGNDKKRHLLFIPGTFLSAQATFSTIAEDVMEKLEYIYEGRLVAFDHPTIHISLEDNVDFLLKNIPVDCELDIICHSRGGLVARALTQSDLKFKIRKIVCFGTPYLGTPLLMKKHKQILSELLIKKLSTAELEEIYNHIRILVPGLELIPWKGYIKKYLIDILIELISEFPGLKCMNPDDNQIFQVNKPKSVQWYSISSIHQLGFFLGRVSDRELQDVFEAENDGIVPTYGSFYCFGLTQDALPKSNRILLKVNVNHGEYFGALHLPVDESGKTVGDCLVDWLGS